MRNWMEMVRLPQSLVVLHTPGFLCAEQSSFPPFLLHTSVMVVQDATAQPQARSPGQLLLARHVVRVGESTGLPRCQTRFRRWKGIERLWKTRREAGIR